MAGNISDLPHPPFHQKVPLPPIDSAAYQNCRSTVTRGPTRESPGLTARRARRGPRTPLRQREAGCSR
eukprot:764636-Hanusia_phi.AAC.5